MYLKSIIKKIKIYFVIELLIILVLFAGQARLTFLIFSVIFIHEIAHIIVAYFFRYSVSEIFILPFGLLVTIDQVKNDYLFKELLIFLAGPFVNLIIVLILNLSNNTNNLFYLCNLYVLILNLLPIYPLDGGKMLSILLCYFYPYVKAMKITFYFSLFFLVISFILSSLFIKLDVLIISIFLLVMLYKENRELNNLNYRFIINKYLHPNKKLPSKELNNYLSPFKSFFKGKNNRIFRYDEQKLLKSCFEKKY